MLVGRRSSPARRVSFVGLLVALAAAPIVIWAVGAKLNLWPWPKSSSELGVVLGMIGGAIVLFEMLIWPRKWFRGRRLGATKVWLRWHVWLGLASLPVIVLHSGFAWGGSLSAITLMLFLGVIGSGIWGLVLQQYLPTLIRDLAPGETVAAQMNCVGEAEATNARRLVLEILQPKLGDVPSANAAKQLTTFETTTLLPYLTGERRSLASPAEARKQFERFRNALPSTASEPLRKLEGLADRRREWDVQRRMLVWLHGWLVVHLPLSVAMTLFMLVHAVMALKYW